MKTFAPVDIFAAISVILVSFLVFTEQGFAQRQTPNVTSKHIVAAFGFECLSTKFPRAALNAAIRKASSTLPESGYTDGRHAFGYDLDGDGIKEYFVSLQDMAIGDNYSWGIFAVKPSRFLGTIPAEHIYITRKKGKFPTLIAHRHESVSESTVTTYSFHKGRYREDSGSYLSSAYKKNEPQYSARTTDLYLCSRNINY